MINKVTLVQISDETNGLVLGTGLSNATGFIINNKTSK
jgi:hypothetical protein